MKTTIKDIVDFYNEFPEFIGELEVSTRHGFKTIEYADVTAINSEVYTITTKTGKLISGSPDHLLWVNSKWTKLKDVRIDDRVETIDGCENISHIRKETFTEDLYDLQVAEVHEFYANDIVSHNSSMICAVSFALFGKSLRKVNRNQLINSINGKGLLTEIEFETDGGKNTYRVIRGIKPNIFEIYKNDEMINQESHVRDYQKWLECNILKFSHRTFHQVAVLGSGNFTPFMQLPTYQRRQVVEDLLDIHIFSKMSVILKDRASALKNRMTVTSMEIKANEDRLKLQKSHIQRLKTILAKMLEDSAIEQKQLEDQIEKNLRGILVPGDQLERSLSEKKKQESELLTEKEEASHTISNLNRDLSSLETDVTFFTDNEVCPKCNSKLTKAHRDRHIKSFNKDMERVKKDIAKATSVKNEYESQLAELYTEIENIRAELEKISEILTKNSYLQASLKKLQEKTTNTNDIQKDIDLERKNIDITSDALTSHRQEFDQQKLISRYINELAELLKDTGIKSKIIAHYLPIMNKCINHYLETLDFFVSFTLNENFEESIRSRHRDDFSYDSFSEGEKLRIDMSILFAWRQIARLKNSLNTNILIMDEIGDSSLDNDGIDNLIKILETLDPDTSVFVISHRGDLLESKFENRLEFAKEKLFTKLLA